MRFLLPFLMAAGLFATAPAPVAHVDPERFSGLWYEIARTDNPYERECVAATVEYTLESAREYDVRNRCFRAEIGGELIEYNGSAEAAAGDSMSRIDMTYFWIFTREYRVIFLTDDYQSAVVTDAKMEQLWIMHREPFMPQPRLGEILSLLETRMDLNRLIFTPQDPQGHYK